MTVHFLHDRPIELGAAPSKGRRGEMECLAFKRIMRARIGVGEGFAHLHMEFNTEGKSKMQIIFTGEPDSETTAWVEAAQGHARKIWQEVTQQPALGVAL